MSETEKPTIYTIGHSTRTMEEFLDLLLSFKIKIVADIRKMPGSRKFPQFDQDALKESLAQNGIDYQYLEKLGGRRKISKDSKNTAWRNKSFQAYADYMETKSFAQGIRELEIIAKQKPTTMMCSEAVWWRCHRSMVSDALKAKGWEVLHVMAVNKATEHPFTSPAKVVNGKVSYTEKDAE